MKKGISFGILFLIIGLVLLCLTIFVVIPTAKSNSENCTLEVKAVVTGNREYTKSDSDNVTRTYYNQEIKYQVNGKEYERTIYSHESDPIEEGTTIIIWVDPEDPTIMTENKDWKLISVAATTVSSVFIFIGIFIFIFVFKKQGLLK